MPLHRSTCPRPTGRARRVLALGAVVLALVATACEPAVVERVNERRTAGGQPALPVSATLTATARATSAAMCRAGRAVASRNPLAVHDQESATAIRELVASARLDPKASAAGANAAATDEIWARWRADGTLTQARWDEIGVGEVTCGNGRLYLTAVLRDRPTMPATGLYSSPQYADAAIVHTAAVTYGTAVDSQGATQQLLLDVYEPPAGGPARRPAVIAIHGGGFVGGSRSTTNEVARQWALRGYVGISMDYRLDKRPGGTAGAGQLAAAANGIDDGMEAVRWLKAHADQYRVDPTKVLAQGFSAGGAIALGMALADDPTPGGPFAAQSPAIAGAISTGAHLTPGLSVLRLAAGDPPIQMYVYEEDETGFTAPYAFETCAATRAAGSSCDFVLQPGTGHTAWLTPGAPFWTTQLGPWAYTALRLGG